MIDSQISIAMIQSIPVMERDGEVDEMIRAAREGHLYHVVDDEYTMGGYVIVRYGPEGSDGTEEVLRAFFARIVRRDPEQSHYTLRQRTWQISRCVAPPAPPRPQLVPIDAAVYAPTDPTDLERPRRVLRRAILGRATYERVFVGHADESHDRRSGWTSHESGDWYLDHEIQWNDARERWEFR